MFHDQDNKPSQFPEKHNLAVVGSGISGLTAAVTWLRCHPENKVHVFEAKEQLGGWCTTATAGVPMEEGARMLMNNQDAKGFYELAYFAGELDGLVGTNPKCRESFIVDC